MGYRTKVTLPCNRCDGEGFTVSESSDGAMEMKVVSGCYKCGGDGTHYIYPSHPKDVKAWNRRSFDIKKGSGKVTYSIEVTDEKCDYCEGTGKLNAYQCGHILHIQPPSYSAPAGYSSKKQIIHQDCFGTGRVSREVSGK